MGKAGRRWELAIATVAALGVVVFLGLAAVTAIPPVLANLASVTSTGEPFDLGPDARVVVPEGWNVTRSGDAVIVRTPDSGMQAVLTPVTSGPAEAIESVTVPGVADLVHGAVRVETLASGLTVAHADIADAQAVIAAVSPGEGGPSVAVAAWSAAPMSVYRPALADLLEGIGFV